MGLERERKGAFALSLFEKVGGFGEGRGALLNIFGFKYQLVYNKVSRTMRVTGNCILCLKLFRSQAPKY